MTTEFADIWSSGSHGKLRLATSGLAWQNSADKNLIVTIPSTNMRYGTITRAARGYQLELTLKKGDDRAMFDGFKREDTERLVNLFNSHFSIVLETRELSLRGWNWGKAEIQGSDLAFVVAGKSAFTVPVSYVHNTSINKTEVALEFLRPEGAGQGAKRKGASQPDELIEMRLYIPGTASSARKRERKDKVKRETNGDGVKDESGSDADMNDSEGEGDPDEPSAAQAFHDEIKDKAEVGHVAGESLVTFSEIHCATPRGRYDIDLFPTFFRLRSKSYDYKILYSSVIKLFTLPRTDDINVIFVANLDPPIRQGQTRYPYLVMQFARDEDMEAEINLTDEQLEEYKSRNINLEKRYDAPAFEVVSSIFRQLTGKKPVIPNGTFQSNDGQTAVKCNLKANEGYLYFLERYMLYIAKQPLLIPFAEVHVVKFERVSGVLGSSRTIDLRVILRSGDEHVFSSLGKDEHTHISEYLQDRKVTVKNEMHDEMIATQSAITAALKAADSSESDESMSEDDAPRKSRRDDDDDESEVDEDFKADSDASDVAEEFDENYKSSGDSSASGDEGGDMDVDDATDKPTKRKGEEQGGGAAKKQNRG